MRYSLREHFTFNPHLPVCVRKPFNIEGKDYKPGTIFEWETVMVNGKRIDDRMLIRMFDSGYLANVRDWSKITSEEDAKIRTERALAKAEKEGNTSRFIHEMVGKSWVHIYDQQEKRCITPKTVPKGEAQDVIKEYLDALEKKIAAA